ncbi:hypothetical protein CEXT_396131 [Caerostris extrusa]|uniref:Uncharacterized protein n=1 Tax=Caerostris extrusa TaxID=172846 RepID=A0AAV4MTX7_CAEEX|nr:hypothetical protein CEXT_396131 [Caerostris extrusa]
MLMQIALKCGNRLDRRNDVFKTWPLALLSLDGIGLGMGEGGKQTTDAANDEASKSPGAIFPYFNIENISLLTAQTIPPPSSKALFEFAKALSERNVSRELLFRKNEGFIYSCGFQRLHVGCSIYGLFCMGTWAPWVVEFNMEYFAQREVLIIFAEFGMKSFLESILDELKDILY